MRKSPAIFAIFLVLSVSYGASAATVVVQADDCARLVEHVPNSDVAYQPGVDAYGRKVTSADLGGTLRIKPPREIKSPIQIDLQKKFGVPTDTTLFSTSDTTVGTVTYRDGRLWYDGQPLQDEETARIAKLLQVAALALAHFQFGRNQPAPGPHRSITSMGTPPPVSRHCLGGVLCLKSDRRGPRRPPDGRTAPARGRRCAFPNISCPP